MPKLLDAPQVPCSVSDVLNREETLNVPSTVLANNSSDEDQHSDRIRWFDNRGSTSAELVVYIVLAIVIAAILVHVAIDLGSSATTVGTLAGNTSAEILKNISIS